MKNTDLFSRGYYSEYCSKYRNCFLFFFVLSICGYLSLIVSSDPYNDDYCRNLANIHVGTLSGLRCLTFFLEKIIYLNGPITDTAPFTQIIASLFLASTAILCLKIFDIDINKCSKWEVLCLFPIVINPYMLEVMMYHFDCIFMTFSLFLVVLSAYVSSFNNKRYIFIQTSLLFLSLFVYQAAISAYLIIFLYKLIKETEKQSYYLKRSASSAFVAIFTAMLYWFYSLLLCALFYAPFVNLISYSKDKNGELFAVPTTIENCRIIITNISRYLQIIFNDWSVNLAGQIFLCLFGIFIVMSLTKAWRASKSKLSSILIILMVLFLSFLLLLAPCGTYYFLKSAIFEKNISIPSRMIYSAGIFIAIILHESYLSFKVLKRCFLKFYCVLEVVLATWTIFFLNSAGNIIRYFRILEDLVVYDMSKEIHEVTNSYPNLSELCVKGSVSSPALINFMNQYPMIERIIPEKWFAPIYSRIALMNPYFPTIQGTGEMYEEHKYKNKIKMKEKVWYDSYILDNKMLLFELKGNSKWSNTAIPIIKIRKIISK